MNMATKVSLEQFAPSSPESLVDLLGREQGTINECLVARAARDPDARFLQYAGETWSYRNALEEVQRFAGYVNSLFGDQRTQRVAGYLSNCPEALWTWLGTVWSGRVYIPLNREHRSEILFDMLGRSKAGLIVTDASGMENLEESGNLEALNLTSFLLVDYESNNEDFRNVSCAPFTNVSHYDPAAPFDCSPGDAACILYSSGTTGRSKAVVIPHNQYCRGAARLVDAYVLLPTDVFHQWLPLYHLGGQLHMTMSAILCGGTVGLFKTFSRSGFREQVDEVGATVICGVSAIIEMLMSLPETEWDHNNSLRIGIIGGIPADKHLAFEKRFGLRIKENYGMTECDPITHPYPGESLPLGSCGRAGQDVEIAIFDETGQRCGVGESGQIAFRPLAEAIMALGYDGDAEATRRARLGDWFVTSDMGCMDAEGYLYYRGRKNKFVRCRGENISCIELESIVAKHPDIIDSVVLGVPSELGEDEIKIVLATARPENFDVEEFCRWCTDRMAMFMVPRYIEVRSALPKSELGKVLVGSLMANTADTYEVSIGR